MGAKQLFILTAEPQDGRVYFTGPTVQRWLLNVFLFATIGVLTLTVATKWRAMDSLAVFIYGIVATGLLLFWGRYRRDYLRMREFCNSAGGLEQSSQIALNNTRFYMEQGLAYMCILVFLLNMLIDRLLK